VDIEYTLGRQIRVKRDVLIGRMPIMLRSDRCWLGSSTEADLTRQGTSLRLPLARSARASQ